ncbi:hypothetical protein [Burkholderia oklahomensis]|uniref:Uncharacterized protein n=1 Tax=Burkholderia oklahomensis TaxID=342113 RepID=A0AAI8FN19_9BURK|nr:hypothetical protein [Burkholderia oklahomensis]AIO66410.1 hypothetical protein DM82_2035 [Burkholderia oklahomensis]QPS36513.1 hypothetical protein I6G57_14435 [Burkholderia oklahomensis]
MTAAWGQRQDRPNEQVTGNGGNALPRISSKQVTVDLNDRDKAALAQVQVRRFDKVTNARLLDASVSVLKAMGFSPVTADAQTALVEGRLARVVGERWRLAVRALFKARGIPLVGQARP